MSAECSTHGCDILYPAGTWPVGECPLCVVEELRLELADCKNDLEIERGRHKQTLGVVEELREALERIVGLQRYWDAPTSTDDHELSNRTWAAVGSEAHKIACDVLASSSSVAGSGGAE